MINAEDMRLFPELKFNFLVKAPILTLVTFFTTQYFLNFMKQNLKNPLERFLYEPKPFRFTRFQKFTLIPGIFIVYTIFYSIQFSKKKEIQINKYQDILDRYTETKNIPDISREELFNMLASKENTL